MRRLPLWHNARYGILAQSWRAGAGAVSEMTEAKLVALAAIIALCTLALCLLVLPPDEL